MSNLKRKRIRRVKSIDLCSCGHFGCDHMASPDSPAHRKIQKRLSEGLCMGCGKKEVKGKCGCKHKGMVDYNIPTAREKELMAKRTTPTSQVISVLTNKAYYSGDYVNSLAWIKLFGKGNKQFVVKLFDANIEIGTISEVTTPEALSYGTYSTFDQK